MKKSGILNAQLSRIIASMGHTDRLVICDSGLPIPPGKELVDLALATNVPRFMETLRVVLQELEVERALVADELLSGESGLYDQIRGQLGSVQLDAVPHEHFKQQTAESGKISFVRTGEATPYANIMLFSGVTF